MAVIGLRLGGGSNRSAGNISGGATALYRVEAGKLLDSFSLGPLLTASSGVAIFQASSVTAVPEPQSCALMLAGLLAVDFVARPVPDDRPDSGNLSRPGPTARRQPPVA